MPKPPSTSSQSSETFLASQKLQAVPAENVEILRQGLGVDVANLTPEKMRALVRTISGSISSSPHSSAEMLQEYVQRGFPDLPEKVVRAIDQQVAHRQSLEKVVTQNQEKEKTALNG